MKIQSIEIKDVFGTKHARFRPGTVTVVSGANGSGKSSILRALLAVFEGGHDPTMIRKGAKRGSVQVELDTGTVVSLGITPTATTLEIVDPNGVVVPSPRKFMEGLGESMAVDPGKLLTLDVTTAAGKKALMTAILAAMPVSFSRGELPEAARGLMNGRQQVGLDDLAKIRNGIEETRRRIGVEVRDADGAIRDLRKSLPEDGEQTDWSEVADARGGELLALERALADNETVFRQDKQRERQDALDTYTKAEADIRERMRVDLEAISAVRATVLSTIDAELQAIIEDAKQVGRADRDRLTADLATAKEKAAQSERVAGARETIANLEQKWAYKSDEYDKLTVVIEKLDQARKAKLESLQVQGLEFDGENILVDGVEWQNVNTARRVIASLELCGLRAGELPFLIIDNCEHLDAAVWEQVKAAAADSGFQLVAARVSNSGPLKIETNEAQA